MFRRAVNGSIRKPSNRLSRERTSLRFRMMNHWQWKTFKGTPMERSHSVGSRLRKNEFADAATNNRAGEPLLYRVEAGSATHWGLSGLRIRCKWCCGWWVGWGTWLTFGHICQSLLDLIDLSATVVKLIRELFEVWSVRECCRSRKS